jgi:hypothetical protein
VLEGGSPKFGRIVLIDGSFGFEFIRATERRSLITGRIAAIKTTCNLG